jgi:putative RNA 2'-phosphotransferase
LENQRHTKLSKFLCLILRHKPETIGIELDIQGWADVSKLIENLNNAGKRIDIETLKEVVETDNKNRFLFNENFKKIRANQGHSINIHLGYNPQQPPEFLYHGTAEKFVDSILENGLKKKNRNHVHLSVDRETALKVGERHGTPFVFLIFSGQMFSDGHTFYLSENGVWLTDEVPCKYLKASNP